MVKLDGYAIPMIMGDLKLVIEALEEKYAKNLAIDLESIDDEDEVAQICEDMDKLEGLLAYLKGEFEKYYGSYSATKVCGDEE
ncbi:MAG: hypothetical protein VX185_09560 [Pseudomonadota bacterium]|nr:hypothetical protein [Pseudomonadota bacterium]